MIYARSRRPLLRFGAVALLLAVACGGAAAGLIVVRAPANWIALPAGLAAGGFAVCGWLAWRGRRWAESRLCLFQDRLLVVQAGRATPVLWNRIEVVTLAARGEGWMSQEQVRLGETLTLVQRRAGRPIAFRPREMGLQPAACRDLILRYRDDPEERRRLPEFDSALDLRGPAVASELRRSAR